jgi:methylated-DNA-[protein]-cysteine S-methyltransferase
MPLLTEIFTTTYQSPLGILRISAREQYIQEISYLDPVEENPSEMYHAELPPILVQCIEQLIQYFHGQRRVFDLPLNQEGTAFQKKVWNELIGIPYGRTISYLELARRLGDSKVIRAAASANGKNNIAIVVPCHRVIGSNNDLVGYGGGLSRKKWLLGHETKIANGVQTLF